MKKYKFKLDKRLVGYSVISAVLGLIAVLIINIAQYQQENNNEVPFLADFTILISALVIFAISILPLGTIRYILVRFFENPAYKTGVNLWVQKKAQEKAFKNSQYISYYLKSFLYDVIKSNDIIDIPVNEASINLKGYAMRNRCVIYRFVIPIAEVPHIDEANLRTILQNTVIAQLNHYGIVGLSSVYQDSTTVQYSVYIDKITYFEDEHIIAIDVLYVCTQNDLLYLQNAVKRDTVNAVNIERTVYDEDI